MKTAKTMLLLTGPKEQVITNGDFQDYRKSRIKPKPVEVKAHKEVSNLYDMYDAMEDDCVDNVDDKDWEEYMKYYYGVWR